MTKTTPWWRWALAGLVFVLAAVGVPIAAGIFLTISNRFLPRIAGQMSSGWIMFVSYLAGPLAAYAASSAVLKQKKATKLQTVLCVVAAAYMLFTAIVNQLAGANTTVINLSVGISGVIYAWLALQGFKELRKGRGSDGRNT